MSEKLLQPNQLLVSRYRIVSFLAEGGMQEVYIADDQSLDRRVAIKAPKNASAEKRFDRSARLSARIQHENVAKTLDYIEDGDQNYLVEELVTGYDLQRILNERVKLLDPHLAANVFHRLSKGVGAAHHAGVVHRDLKPNNIIVSDDPTVSVVKLTDFGIAKMTAAEFEVAFVDPDSQSFMSSQTALGAIPFMAPEMFDNAKGATTAADVWALGAILCRLISGVLPFGSGMPAIRKILECQLPERPIILNRPQFSDLGGELWDLAISCLRLDASKRPTADELIERCDELYYSTVNRGRGVVEVFPAGTGNHGRIRGDDGGTVFFHGASFYSEAKIQVGLQVEYCEFSGEPFNRAFPVIEVSRPSS